MKKFRLYYKGSPAEKRFLLRQKQKGRILESIDWNLYSFIKNPQLKDTELQIEFFNLDIPFNQEAPDKLIKQLTRKKLNFSDKEIIYSYLDPATSSSPLNDTHDLEIDYLNMLKRKYLVFALPITISLMILSFFLICVKTDFRFTSFVFFLLFFFWLLILVFLLKVEKRLNLLDNTEVLAPERTVIINSYPQGKPEILPDLAFLGHWRYITSKKKTHYFRIASKFSEDDIANEIASLLDISPNQVQVISNFGLAPIGYFLFR